MFDFNPVSYGVHMQVAEASDVQRYDKCSAPRWMNIAIEPPDFVSTPNLNSILALLHFNHGDCSIVPYDHKNIYEVQELYNLEQFIDVIDVKSCVASQAL